MRWIYSMVLAIAIAATGCSSARVYSDKVQGANFSGFKTYAWLPTAKDTSNNSVISSDITNQNIRAAADKEMEKRGMRLDTENPDVLLLLHTDFEQRQELVRSPVYSSYSYYYPGFYAGPWYPFYYSGYYNMPYVTGYDIRQIQYTEGMVILDVIDRKKQQLVWRGWSEEEIDSQGDIDKLYKNVEDIFDKYPVKEAKKK